MLMTVDGGRHALGQNIKDSTLLGKLSARLDVVSGDVQVYFLFWFCDKAFNFWKILE